MSGLGEHRLGHHAIGQGIEFDIAVEGDRVEQG